MKTDFQSCLGLSKLNKGSCWNNSPCLLEIACNERSLAVQLSKNDKIKLSNMAVLSADNQLAISGKDWGVKSDDVRALNISLSAKLVTHDCLIDPSKPSVSYKFCVFTNSIFVQILYDVGLFESVAVVLNEELKTETRELGDSSHEMRIVEESQIQKVKKFINRFFGSVKANVPAGLVASGEMRGVFENEAMSTNSTLQRKGRTETTSERTAKKVLVVEKSSKIEIRDQRFGGGSNLATASFKLSMPTSFDRSSLETGSPRLPVGNLLAPFGILVKKHHSLNWNDINAREKTIGLYVFSNKHDDMTPSGEQGFRFVSKAVTSLPSWRNVLNTLTHSNWRYWLGFQDFDPKRNALDILRKRSEEFCLDSQLSLEDEIILLGCSLESH